MSYTSTTSDVAKYLCRTELRACPSLDTVNIYGTAVDTSSLDQLALARSRHGVVAVHELAASEAAAPHVVSPARVGYLVQAGPSASHEFPLVQPRELVHGDGVDTTTAWHAKWERRVGEQLVHYGRECAVARCAHRAVALERETPCFRGIAVDVRRRDSVHRDTVVLDTWARMRAARRLQRWWRAGQRFAIAMGLLRDRNATRRRGALRMQCLWRGVRVLWKYPVVKNAARLLRERLAFRYLFKKSVLQNEAAFKHWSLRARRAVFAWWIAYCVASSKAAGRVSGLEGPKIARDHHRRVMLRRAMQSWKAWMRDFASEEVLLGRAERHNDRALRTAVWRALCRARMGLQNRKVRIRQLLLNVLEVDWRNESNAVGVCQRAITMGAPRFQRRAFTAWVDAIYKNRRRIAAAKDFFKRTMTSSVGASTFSTWHRYALKRRARHQLYTRMAAQHAHWARRRALAGLRKHIADRNADRALVTRAARCFAQTTFVMVFAAWKAQAARKRVNMLKRRSAMQRWMRVSRGKYWGAWVAFRDLQRAKHARTRIGHGFRDRNVLRAVMLPWVARVRRRRQLLGRALDLSRFTALRHTVFRWRGGVAIVNAIVDASVSAFSVPILAATQIQAVWRGVRAARHVARYRKRRTRAAVLMQRLMRHRLVRKLLLKNVRTERLQRHLAMENGFYLPMEREDWCERQRLAASGTHHSCHNCLLMQWR